MRPKGVFHSLGRNGSVHRTGDARVSGARIWFLEYIDLVLIISTLLLSIQPKATSS